MATLNSPGISVEVTDESFYSTAAPGTVPLIIAATAENKQKASGTGTAEGTTQANSGQVYLITSQRELVETFGTPVFKTDVNNNPIHAGEQNEYGLQAAYSYLGVSNRAYVVRADVDLSELNATSTEPTGTPEDGTFWFDTSSTKFGIFEWDSAIISPTGGQVFTNKTPIVITDTAKLLNYSSITGDNDGPKLSIGSVGDYAIVAVSSVNVLWFKKPKTNTDPGLWVQVGTPEWKASWPAAQSSAASSVVLDPDTSILTFDVEGGVTPIDVDNATNIAGLVSEINGKAALNTAGIKAQVINNRVEIYSNGKSFELSGTTATAIGLGTVGVYYAPKLEIKPHTQIPVYKRASLPSSNHGYPTGSLWIKTTSPNLGANWVVKKFSDATGNWSTVSSPLYQDNAAALANLDKTGGGLNLPVGTLYVKYNTIEESPNPLADFSIHVRNKTGQTTITSTSSTGISASTYTFNISETVKNNPSFTDDLLVSVTVSGVITEDAISEALIAALTAKLSETELNGNPYVSNIVASKNSANKVVISHKLGGDIKFEDVSGELVGTLFSASDNFFNDPSLVADKYVASNWTSTVNDNWFAEASSTALTTAPLDGRLWYNSTLYDVDIMINNGTTWIGYKNYTANANTDVNGPIISATEPKLQSDGNTAVVNGDLWIDSSDLENYPKLYRRNASLGKWVLIDNTDQTTENGIVFGDARWDDTGESDTPSTIKTLLTSNFLDPDAPDPALYPEGTLLWNLRRSGFNVKKFVRNYIDLNAENDYMNTSMSDYYPHRWVSQAPLAVDGSGTFGRKAQRAVVVTALQALVASNQQIREEESRLFNLIACPGYPELMSSMISLNYDRGLTAFVVGDTPARLASDATSLQNWGANLGDTFANSGLTSYDAYLGVFYPWGYTSDNLGNNVVVPPSHMMLRTIALSDNVSYPWFAPAGTRRGGITNATAVGYVNDEGEFQSVSLNTGQRDTLAEIKINPITFISGTGLVNYGQYTRYGSASALDRINVARLVVYLRRRFSQLAKPYVFEPNDKITRDELRGAAENLLLELVGQRALYDYVVVCDESNNTPARIDRNELYLDIAIEPVKAVEFIYIPLRLKNTGEIKSAAGR